MQKINIGTYAFGMQSPLSLVEKFKKAKEMGFTGIELLANDLQNNTPEQILAWANEAGVEIVSSHVAAPLIEELLPKFVALGGKLMVVPSYNFADKDEAIALAKVLEEKAKLAAPYGIKIAYHNHNQEFFVSEGKPILEWVIENTEPGLVWFQLDCGWATAAGIDAAEFINKYPGRFISIHVKENDTVIGTGEPTSSKAPPRQMPKFEIGEDGKPIMPPEFLKMMEAMRERMKIQCPIGAPQSRIDWKKIKAATDAQGDYEVIWTVEREHDYAGDILKCLADDAAWVKANV